MLATYHPYDGVPPRNTPRQIRRGKQGSPDRAQNLPPPPNFHHRGSNDALVLLCTPRIAGRSRKSAPAPPIGAPLGCTARCPTRRRGNSSLHGFLLPASLVTILPLPPPTAH